MGELTFDLESPAVYAGVSAAALSPNGSRWLMLAWSTRPGVVLWDTATNTEITYLADRSSPTFNPDGSLIAACSRDDVALWDAAAVEGGSSEPLVALPTTGVRYGGCTAGFSADGTLLFTKDGAGVSVWGVVE